DRAPYSSAHPRSDVHDHGSCMGAGRRDSDLSRWSLLPDRNVGGGALMLPIRTEVGPGYSQTAPSEHAYLTGTLRSWRAENPLMIYFHGSGNTASTMANTPGQYSLLRALSQRFMVIAADLGGEVWGNDTHIDRATEAMGYMSDRFGYDPS